MRIHCPYCKERDASEFFYGGDATKVRPDCSILETPDHTPVPEDLKKSFYDYVYKRKNPRGEHQEYWYHSGGCRRWLCVTRNTLTHEITDVRGV